jgi:hypothetical protein
MRNSGLLILLSLVLCACTALSANERSALLDYTTGHYEQAFRWGDTAAAGKFRRPGDPAAGASLTGGGQVKVTGCEIMQSTPSADGNAATVNVRISYYHEDAMMVKTLVDAQHWQYDAAQRAWYITSPPPKFE